jgi:hypothetical protein
MFASHIASPAPSVHTAWWWWTGVSAPETVRFEI